MMLDGTQNKFDDAHDEKHAPDQDATKLDVLAKGDYRRVGQSRFWLLSLRILNQYQIRRRISPHQGQALAIGRPLIGVNFQ